MLAKQASYSLPFLLNIPKCNNVTRARRILTEVEAGEADMIFKHT